MSGFKVKSCYDIDRTELKKPDKYVCEECEKVGDKWVHLRKCQECGTTLCCDSSPNQHATRHYHATRHSVFLSAEPGEKWIWCYKHAIFIDNFYD